MTVEVLFAAGTETLRADVVVDTGFTGHLTLPFETVETLSLPILGGEVLVEEQSG